MGAGYEFRDRVPILRSPDPRRIDMRVSIRDPFEQVYVREYRQRVVLPVYAITDLSASMAVVGGVRKLDLAADFVTSLGYSIYRTGDVFGFIGCDDVICTEFLQPLTRIKTAGGSIAMRMRDHNPNGRGAASLPTAAKWVTRERSLIFLLSDFYLSPDFVDQTLTALTPHKIVPVMLLDSEDSQLNAFGLMRFVDSESGKCRTVFWRPALRVRIMERFTAHHKQLKALFLKHGLTPLMIRDRFSAEEVTSYFYPHVG